MSRARALVVSGLLVALLSAGTLHAGEEPAAQADPWIGKPIADVIAILGTPTKVKGSEGGPRTLTYRLLRIRPGAVPPPGVGLVQLNGIGMVGQDQVAKSPDPDSIRIEPTELDRQGRSVNVGTGGAQVQEAGATYDLKSKELKTTPDPNAGVLGKLKVRFRVDAGGKIVEWTVSPKSALTKAK
ncbi:hypothetical protein ABI59_21215 [Acidobacteria bacterium Mor1]|nr:hypothetical protein ABI59_21215 [Acidobacteria bacterium Mor1]